MKPQKPTKQTKCGSGLAWLPLFASVNTEFSEPTVIVGHLAADDLARLADFGSQTYQRLARAEIARRELVK